MMLESQGLSPYPGLRIGRSNVIRFCGITRVCHFIFRKVLFGPMFMRVA